MFPSNGEEVDLKGLDAVRYVRTQSPLSGGSGRAEGMHVRDRAKVTGNGHPDRAVTVPRR